MNIAVIFAGGTGTRMKHDAKPKQFIELYRKPIIIYTLEIFQSHPDIDQIVIPCVAGWEEYLQKLIEKFAITKVKAIVPGGKDTQESKMSALDYIYSYCNDDDIVLLHDAVRPLIDEDLITRNIESTKKYGNAISALPFTETGIISDDGLSCKKTIIRNTLCIARAPQTFYFIDVYEAHKIGKNMPPEITIDTCSLMTELGKTLYLVPTKNDNIKITNPEDYFIFKAFVDMKESADVWGV